MTLKTFLTTALFIAMTSTVLFLVLGIVGMFTGSPFYQRYRNQLMQCRVMAQGIALILFALLLLGY